MTITTYEAMLRRPCVNASLRLISVIVLLDALTFSERCYKKRSSMSTAPCCARHEDGPKRAEAFSNEGQPFPHQVLSDNILLRASVGASSGRSLAMHDDDDWLLVKFTVQ